MCIISVHISIGIPCYIIVGIYYTYYTQDTKLRVVKPSTAVGIPVSMKSRRNRVGPAENDERRFCGMAKELMG